MRTRLFTASVAAVSLSLFGCGGSDGTSDLPTSFAVIGESPYGIAVGDTASVF